MDSDAEQEGNTWTVTDGVCQLFREDATEEGCPTESIRHEPLQTQGDDGLLGRARAGRCH